MRCLRVQTLRVGEKRDGRSLQQGLHGTELILSERQRDRMRMIEPSSFFNPGNMQRLFAHTP